MRKEEQTMMARTRKWFALISESIVAAVATARRAARRHRWLRSLRSSFRLYF
jgi:hypothetical protein